MVQGEWDWMNRAPTMLNGGMTAQEALQAQQFAQNYQNMQAAQQPSMNPYKFGQKATAMSSAAQGVNNPSAGMSGLLGGLGALGGMGGGGGAEQPQQQPMTPIQPKTGPLIAYQRPPSVFNFKPY